MVEEEEVDQDPHRQQDEDNDPDHSARETASPRTTRGRGWQGILHWTLGRMDGVGPHELDRDRPTTISQLHFLEDLAQILARFEDWSVPNLNL